MTGGWSRLSSGNPGWAWTSMEVSRKPPCNRLWGFVGNMFHRLNCPIQARSVCSRPHYKKQQLEPENVIANRGEDEVVDLDAAGQSLANHHSIPVDGFQGKDDHRESDWPWISVIPPELSHYTERLSKERRGRRELAEQNGNTLRANYDVSRRQKKPAFPKISKDGNVENLFPVSTPGKICALLGKYGWSGHTVLELRTYLAQGLKLKPSQVCEVLSRQKDAEVAYNFLQWALDEGRCKVHMKCFTVVLQLVGRVRKFDLLESLLEDVHRRGYAADKILLTAAMRSYAEGQMTQEAMDIFVRMKEIGFKPDCVTYTVLVHMFSKAKLYQEALKLYEEVLVQGVATDTQLYNCVVSTLGKAGRMDLAYEKMQEMRERGHVPDQFTYGVLIGGYVRAGRQEYMNLYKEMQNAGVPFNEVIFNMMFSGVDRMGTLEDAERLFADMERVGLRANLITFSTLIGMCAIIGNADGAQRWFDKMLSLSLQPTLGIGNSLLEGYSRARKFSRAKQVLDSFQVWGIVPNLATLTVCLRCLGMCKRSEDLKVVQEMLSCHTGSKFLSALLEKSAERNVGPIIASFLGSLDFETRKSRRDFVNVLIDYLYRNGYYNQAYALWEGATANYVFPALVEQGSEGICSINLGGMDCGTAIIALTHTLPRLAKQFHRQEMTPTWVQIYTHQVSDHSSSKDPMTVHRSIDILLRDLRSPFEAGTLETGGGFVCRGEQVVRWIDQPEIKALLAYNQR